MSLSVLLGVSTGICLGMLGIGFRELLLGNLAYFAGASVVSIFAGIVGYFLFNLKRREDGIEVV